MKPITSPVVMAATLLASASIVNAQSFTNGSFEDYTGGALSNHPNYLDFGAFGSVEGGMGSDGVPDSWNHFSSPTGEFPMTGAPVWASIPSIATDGENVVGLEVFADENFDHQVSGGISQIVTGFSTGQAYQVTFDAARFVLEGEEIPPNAPTAIMGFYLDGVLTNSLVFNNDDVTGSVVGGVPSTPIGSLSSYSFNFIAGSETLDIGFRLSNGALGEFSSVVIDNLNIISVPVPEPSAIFLISLAGTLGVLRRRRHAS